MDTLLVGAGLLLLVFLGARSLWLWYWKIDRVVALLEEQTAQQKTQTELLIKLLATQKTALLEGKG